MGTMKDVSGGNIGHSMALPFLDGHKKASLSSLEFGLMDENGGRATLSLQANGLAMHSQEMTSILDRILRNTLIDERNLHFVSCGREIGFECEWGANTRSGVAY